MPNLIPCIGSHRHGELVEDRGYSLFAEHVPPVEWDGDAMPKQRKWPTIYRKRTIFISTFPFPMLKRQAYVTCTQIPSTGVVISQGALQGYCSLFYGPGF